MRPIRCMSEGRSLYRIFDKDASLGCHAVKDFTEADEWNEKGWGIFWTVNRFEGPRRKENCREVLAWAVDIDERSKQQQLERIKSIPLNPSAVYETARGHHVYFDAIGADPENYREIVERLIDAYGGDQNAKDVCRILRVPAYLHWKDQKPFGIKAVHLSFSAYTEQEMREAFPRDEKVERVIDAQSDLRRTLKPFSHDDLWQRIWNLNCEMALSRLSGTSAVNFEKFSFKRTATGNLNILVNGKSTSCWLDRDRRIGSHDRGGPTIFNWVNWYQRDAKRTVEILKSIFPEIAK